MPAKLNIYLRFPFDQVSVSNQWPVEYDLRQRGFKFVGSTICYAHMQATGMVDDHTVDCFRRHEIIAAYELDLKLE